MWLQVSHKVQEEKSQDHSHYISFSVGYSVSYLARHPDTDDWCANFLEAAFLLDASKNEHTRKSMGKAAFCPSAEYSLMLISIVLR